MAHIVIEGLGEFQQLLEEMTITDAEERSSMKKAIEVIAKKLEADTPKGESGKLSKVKKSVKKDGLGIVGEVKTGAHWDIFQEFGTSYQKANVGYFERSVDGSKDEALEILIKELLKNLK